MFRRARSSQTMANGGGTASNRNKSTTRTRTAARLGTPAGHLSFEFYPEDGDHYEAAVYDAQLREPLAPYENRTIGVVATQFVTANGHYQVYLTVGDESTTTFYFNLADGQVTESS